MAHGIMNECRNPLIGNYSNRNRNRLKCINSDYEMKIEKYQSIKCNKLEL